MTDDCQQLREQIAALTARYEEMRAQRDHWLKEWREEWETARAPCQDCSDAGRLVAYKPPLRRVA
jgi:hypothetical protein